MGYSAIYDTPIYSGTPSSNYGTYMLATVGYLGTSGGVNYGVGRMLLKCPTLTSSTQAFNASNATVNSVNLYINEGSGKAASSTVTAYYYTGSSWSETGATYNNISWNGYNTSIASATINSSKLYSYNIKAAYTAWKSGSKSVDSGLMFKNSNESSSTYAKTFCTAEYSPTSQRPYIVVGYSTTNVMLSLSKTTENIKRDHWSALSVTVSSGSVTWSVSNSSLYFIPISELNNLTIHYQPRAVGTYTITVRSTIDTSVYASCTVLVTEEYGKVPFRNASVGVHGDPVPNCHGYAWLMDTTPVFITDAQFQTIYTHYMNGNEAVANSFVVGLYEQSYETYNKEYRSIGANVAIYSNEYRVVFRTGHRITTNIYGMSVLLFDYHLWYQTYNGQWANKHGPGGYPELLPVSVKPESLNTSGWSAMGYSNFYDGPIYYYALTQNIYN
ncbi:hypothetical protein LJB90_00345 [Eubacteriales bacterium OttesenSCG-928-G02]|nr:hypothetical protein [Eubacteriales bacterium OttesenSCG-928-G02]